MFCKQIKRIVDAEKELDYIPSRQLQVFQQNRCGREQLTLGSIVTYCSASDPNDEGSPGRNKTTRWGCSDQTSDHAATKANDRILALGTIVQHAPDDAALSSMKIKSHD